MTVIHVRTRNGRLFQRAWLRMKRHFGNKEITQGDFTIQFGAGQDCYLAWTKRGKLPKKLPNSWKHQ